MVAFGSTQRACQDPRFGISEQNLKALVLRLHNRLLQKLHFLFTRERDYRLRQFFLLVSALADTGHFLGYEVSFADS